jgi:nucleoside-triphosphatase
MDTDSPYRVARYGVDKDGFEAFLATLELLNPNVELVVIDEIGKMELFSNRFRNLVCDVLNNDKQVLATIPLKGNDFTRGVKQRIDIHLIEVTHASRDRLPESIVERL